MALIGALIPLSGAWKRRLADPMQGARTTAHSRRLGALVAIQMALVTCVARLTERGGDPARHGPRPQTADALSGFWEGRVNPGSRVEALAAHLGALPGVHGVAWARRAFLSGSGGGAIVDVEVAGQPKYSFRYNQVSPGYFATTGARALSGRPFLNSDTPAATPVAMVNAAFARRFFGSVKATGAWIKINGSGKLPGLWKMGPQFICAKPSSRTSISRSHRCR